MKDGGELVQVRSGPWEQEAGKQWGTDPRERLWTCTFLLRGPPPHLLSSLSVTVKRGRDVSELEGQGEGMRNHQEDRRVKG